MNRARSRTELLERVSEHSEPWDMIVIGGGATGLGVALDSASRGFETLLLEKSDFTKGTSSRSTKLVHGGVRYLKQGQIPLVLEALKERGLLRKNAPHLVRPLRFVLPAYTWWERWFYLIGLKIYDLLARRLSLGTSKLLNREKLSEVVETLKSQGLRGGVLYYDGQMDDARLGLALAKTALDKGALTINYMSVERISYDQESDLYHLTVIDHDLGVQEEGRQLELTARNIVNATGVFVDQLRRLEDSLAPQLVRPSQGVHLVLPKRFLPGDHAIIFPQMPDGRVLFAIPWYDRVILGTTDEFVDQASLEPVPTERECEMILNYAKEYFDPVPQREDVLSIFAGLRPLIAPKVAENDGSSQSASVSREHSIFFGSSGVCHITGGKWTTYRKMSEDVLEALINRGKLSRRPCETESLRLVGWQESEGNITMSSVYGSELEVLESLLSEMKDGETLLHPNLPYRRVEALYAARFELALTVDDVLARRTRALLLDARAAIEAAPTVAQILAEELHRDESWIKGQVKTFTELAQTYIWD